MAANSSVLVLKHGVVQLYNTDEGYGFLSCGVPAAAAAATTAAKREAASSVYFHITSCDVQTPPPRVGERVLFAQQAGTKRPSATVLYRTGIGVTVASITDPPVRAARATNEPIPLHAQQRTKPTRSATKPKEASAPARSSVNASTKAADKAIEKRRKLLVESPSFFEGGKHPRYVYVDLDNVWVSYVRAEHLINQFPGASTTRDLELDLLGFTRRLAEGERGSSVTRLVAFYYNTPEKIAAKLRTMNHNGLDWDVRRQETTTDTSMQLELLNAKRPCAVHPKTLVMVTGDGNIASNGMCFREIMDLYLRDGWFVEVHAWLSTMAKSYIEYQRAYPSTVVIRPFDDDSVGEIVRLRQQIHAGGKVVAQGAKAGPSTGERGRAQPALGQEAEEIRASSLSTPSSTYGTPPPAVVSTKPMVQRSFRAEQYAEIIRLLNGRDGEQHLSMGFAMLAQSGLAMEGHAIRHVDSETQRVLLTTTLNELMDAATWRQLQAEGPTA